MRSEKDYTLNNINGCSRHDFLSSVEIRYESGNKEQVF